MEMISVINRYLRKKKRTKKINKRENKNNFKMPIHTHL